MINKNIYLALISMVVFNLIWSNGYRPEHLLAAKIFTLNEAITMAVENDPETNNAKRSIDIGQTKRSQARLRYFPKLDLGLTNTPQVDYFGQPVINKMLWNSFVGIEQPLYTGGRIKNSVKLAESEIRRQEWEYAVYRQRISTEATKSYFQTLTTQGTVDQYEALLQQGQEDLREAQTRLESGTVSRMDVLEVSSRLLEIQQKLSKARADHQEAMGKLRKVCGLEGHEFLRLINETPLPDIKTDFDSLLSEAYVKRPETQYFSEDLTYSQLRTTIEKSKQKPQLSLTVMHEWQSPQVFESNKNFMVMLKASYSWENTTLSFQDSRYQIYPNAYAYPRYIGAPALQTYYFPVRTLKYSLFDNSSNKVELEQASSARDLARDRWRQDQRGLAEELKSVLAQKNESANRIDLARKQIAMSEELVHIKKTKYLTGLSTAAEVLKARAALSDTRINLLNAQRDYAVSLAQLYRMMGQDLPSLESRL